jgi:hypothetical protein
MSRNSRTEPGQPCTSSRGTTTCSRATHCGPHLACPGPGPGSDEVDCQSVYLCGELLERVQLRFLSSPVEPIGRKGGGHGASPVGPVTAKLGQPSSVHPVAPAGALQCGLEARQVCPDCLLQPSQHCILHPQVEGGEGGVGGPRLPRAPPPAQGRGQRLYLGSRVGVGGTGRRTSVMTR